MRLTSVSRRLTREAVGLNSSSSNRRLTSATGALKVAEEKSELWSKWWYCRFGLMCQRTLL